MVKTAVAIIGATGQMGSAIAKALAKGQYHLLLFAHNTEKLEALQKAIKKELPSADLDCVGCPTNASWEADIIILAVPYKAEKEVAEKIKLVATQKIVVSISNPLNEGLSELISLPNTSAAEELQQLLPSTNVVKAFNTNYATSFSKPLNSGQQADAFIAGNDEEAVNIIKDLVKTAGFNPIDAGDLTVSRTLESMQLLLIRLAASNNGNKAVGYKIVHQ